MYVSPGVGVSFARAFEHVLGGSVALGLSVSYSHPFYHYTTAGTENPTPYQFSCFNAGGDASCNGQVSATANTANSVVALANIGGEWGRFEPSVFFLLSNGWAYTFQNQPGVARLPDSTHFRQATFFGAELDYKLTGWLSAGVGYQMFRASILDAYLPRHEHRHRQALLGPLRPIGEKDREGAQAALFLGLLTFLSPAPTQLA
jgi:hypothetical protein